MTVVFLIYLIFNGILLFHHEMWRDEVNVWLMGRDLSVIELFREIKYQGHPCLWYLLIMPFAKLGLPCRIMGIISYLVMAAGAALYLWKAPIHVAVKAITLFTPIFTYYYTEIARGYCLVAFLIILLAYFYPIRNEKPLFYGLLLGLLVQADTIALPVAGMISVMWLAENLGKSIRERTKDSVLTAAKGLWIPFASLILWIFQFYQVSDSPVYQVSNFGVKDFVKAVIDYCLYIMERLTGLDESVCIWIYAILILGGCILSYLCRNAWSFVVMGTTILFFGVFSCVIYQLNIWHFISLLFVYIWMLWVFAQKKEEKEKGGILLTEKWEKAYKYTFGTLEILLAVIAVFMFVRWNAPTETSSLDNALFGSYSDGEKAAEYIKENLGTDELIVTTDVAFASTILGFAKDHRAYYAGSMEETSYADWSEKQTQGVAYDDLIQWVKNDFREKESFILIQCADSCISGFDGSKEECEILYETKEPSAQREDYTIYRININ